MAIIANDVNLEETRRENQKQSAEQQQAQGQGVGVSGSTADSSSGKPAQAAANPGGPTGSVGTSNNSANTKSGSFTNLQNYVNANGNYNKNNGGLAGSISQNLKDTGQDVLNQGNKSYNEFNNQADQNRIKQDSNFNNLVSGVRNNPTAVANNSDSFKSWQNYLGGNYQGPAGIEDAATLQNNAENYKQLANQTTNESGRYNLLNQFFNKPDYSSGQQSLDNLLLQSNPNQIKNLQQTSAQAGNVGANINKLINNAQNSGQIYANEAQQTGQAAKNVLFDPNNGVINKFDTEAQNKLANYQTQIANNLAQAKGVNSLGGNILTQNQAQQFGIDPTKGIYNLNLANYINPNQTALNKTNALSNDDYLKLQALQKLAAGDASNIFGSYGGADQAGVAQQIANNPFAFDNARFNTDLSAQKAAEDAKIAADPRRQFDRSGSTFLPGMVGNDGNQLNPPTVDPVSGATTYGQTAIDPNTGVVTKFYSKPNAFVENIIDSKTNPNDPMFTYHNGDLFLGYVNSKPVYGAPDKVALKRSSTFGKFDPTIEIPPQPTNGQLPEASRTIKQEGGSWKLGTDTAQNPEWADAFNAYSPGLINGTNGQSPQIIVNTDGTETPIQTNSAGGMRGPQIRPPSIPAPAPPQAIEPVKQPEAPRPVQSTPAPSFSDPANGIRGPQIRPPEPVKPVPNVRGPKGIRLKG